MDKKLVVAVDLGNSKIAVAVAHKINETLDLIDLVQVPSSNLIKNGVVQNSNNLYLKINDIIEKIATNHKIRIGKFAFAVAPHTLASKSINVECSAGNDLKNAESNLKSKAKNIEIANRQIIDVIPIEMSFGVNARGNFLALSLTNSVKELTERATSTLKTSFETERLITPLVEAEMFLSEEQKKNGCALIDFGAGCTSVAVYKDGCLRLCITVPLGGNHITSDIAARYRVDFNTAEQIKTKIGVCSSKFLDTDKAFNINETIDIQQKELSEVICERQSETVNFILQEFENQSITIENLVITGGASKLECLPEFLEEAFAKEVNSVNLTIKTNGTEQKVSAENALLISLLKKCDMDCTKIIGKSKGGKETRETKKSGGWITLDVFKDNETSLDN
ncbi:MAG: pilus assembly protein PilM [Prevotellaceae bacterium]|jgi:cell division protein FtsA|nr:pilus assembly protein PilM [Prevotellaceae bacterium]